MLLDQLKLHRASASFDAPTDFVFATSRGTERNRSNITRQILQPAIARANVELAKTGRSPIEGVTNHSLRRTYCALLYEAGATPAYVMAQMGHTDASLALEVYSKVMERKRDTGARMDELIRGRFWHKVALTAPRRSSRCLSRQQKSRCFQRLLEAAGQGFEPQLPDPESGVLPLDDPATGRRHCSRGQVSNR